MAIVGVSYVAIFILSYNIVMWIGGTASTLSWDYAPGIPQGEAAKIRVGWRQKPVGGYVYRTFFQKKYNEPEMYRDAEAQDSPQIVEIPGEMVSDPDIQLVRRIEIASSNDGPSSVIRPLDDPIPTNVAQPSHENSTSQPTPPEALARFWSVVGPLFSPITLAIYVSLPIALAPVLKSLFVLPPSPSDPYYFIAPDGNPPLHFILNTAAFVGALCVPVSLILLGASFARMNIPRPFLQTVPIWAILWMCMAKLVFLPVIGVLFVQGLVSQGVVQKEELVLRFVAMLLSGTPSATK